MAYFYPLIVVCETSSLTPDLRSKTFRLQGGNTIVMELKQGDIWYCSAYFETRPTGSVTMNLHACDDGLSVKGTPISVLPLVCNEILEGVEFILHHHVDGIAKTCTSDFSKAIFNVVAEGNATARIVLLEECELAVVYCETWGPEGQTIHQYDVATVANDASFELTFDDLETMSCDPFIAKVNL